MVCWFISSFSLEWGFECILRFVCFFVVVCLVGGGEVVCHSFLISITNKHSATNVF